MKNLFLIACILVVAISSFAQGNLEEMEKKRMASNKVKKQTQWSYDYMNGKPSDKGYISCVTSYDTNGNITEIVNYKSDGKITSILNYTYNAKGNKTSYTRYQGNREKMTYSQKLFYDPKGNKISETGYDGSSNFKNSFVYTNGKLSEIKYTTDEILTERRVFTYKGTQTDVVIYTPDNQVAAKEQDIFDTKHNLIEESRYANQNITQKKQYEYDEKGNVLEETKHQYGNFAYKKKYTYNANGYLTQVEDVKTDGKSTVINIYSYDSKGNIMEEKWRKDPTSDFSYKKYTYNDKNLYTSMDCFFSSYKFQVLYKFTYETY